MRRYRWIRALALLAGTLLLTAGCASSQKQAIEVREAWVRPAQAGGETGGYFTILNYTNAPVTLQGVESDWGDASVHETVIENAGAMAKMKHVDSLEVPAKGQLEFKPGGHHVMIENLKRDLSPGQHVTFSIRLGNGTSLPVTAIVQESDGGHGH
jgi:copper(I)-binding protein